MASDGVDFAFVRVGNRGYTEGALYADTRYAENIDNATSAGLDVGAYFFSQAVTVEEAREEAEFVLRLLAGRYLALPVAYDHEPVADGAGRANNMDRETLTACARAFCDGVSEQGWLRDDDLRQQRRHGALRPRRSGRTSVWFAEYDAAQPARAVRLRHLAVHQRRRPGRHRHRRRPQPAAATREVKPALDTFIGS